VSQKKQGSSGARVLPDVTHLQQISAHRQCHHTQLVYSTAASDMNETVLF